MTIREAVQADVPALVAMGRQQIATLYGGAVADHPAHLAALAQQLIAGADSVMLVAIDEDGRPIGMIGMLCFPHHLSGERTAGEVCWWVEPGARGYGLALLKRAERWALEHGATQIQMMAPDARVGALYERRGYALVELSYLKPVTAALAGIQVVDDVLPAWEAYRTHVLQQPFGDVQTGPGVVFHGISPTDDTLPAWIAAHYPRLTPQLTFVRRSPAGQPEPNFIHTDCDMGEWTGIYYLTADPPPGDGTTFWRHRATGAIASTAQTETDVIAEWDEWRDRDQWEPWHTVAAKPNRLVLFPAPYFHSRALEENYGADDDARLIQVVFGSGVPDGGA